MTIDGVSRHEDRSAGAGTQWLLQPRGTARTGGPKHFRHSVREGIRLSDPEYADVLGESAAELHELFPSGIARFWGAVTPKKENDAKGVAVRECKAGDEVLFYGEKKFIARATILKKFRHVDLARRIWGTNDDGAVWEHMIALGDVVEFTADAMPLLAEIDGPNDKLWSMQLVSAPDRARLLDRVDIPSMPAVAQLPVPRKPQTAVETKLERQVLLHALGALRTHTGQDGPSRHKPLALLWSMRRLEAGEDRLAPWGEFEREVGSLLTDFGGTGSRVTPHYPFSRLRSSGIWEVEGISEDIKDPGPGVLRTARAKAGFARSAARLLRQPRLRAEAVNLLTSTYFSAAERALVLARVGLGGYLSASGETDGPEGDTTEVPGGSSGPVKRSAIKGTRPQRNPELIRQVKKWHRDTCQVCSEPLEDLVGHYSEAAHIQGIGSPHEGPDQLSNMLCLCPNHHKQFDRLVIYIDPEWNVRRTRDDELLYALRFHPRHRIEPEHVEYHRVLCGKSAVTGALDTQPLT
ncbi:HNH endonuclease [Streptomyces sp. NPDC047981]|uniref:HNH endonuclease n=1 Tax=Streptomyces sp. NPDC047981 TaxID=3154610 RepID=UPI003437AAC3